MKNNRVFRIQFSYPYVTLTRDGTRRGKSRTYRPSDENWNKLQKIINARIADSGIEFEDISRADVYL